jgi:2-keto-4-pentenoate hydratase/2-oxohepta-3-ene-1,7-dioic acid hydratase in catechol pathway
MRIARFSLNGEIRFGSVVGDQVTLFAGNPFESKELTGQTVTLDQIQLLAPVTPSKIICIGMNFAAHAAEISQDVPDEPLMFFKPVSAIIGTGDTIVLPHQSDQVEVEVELAVVIGKQAKNISKSEVKSHIFGYTIGNDITARDIQFSELQWARAKGFDTFCPLGPWIETDFDPRGKRLDSRIHGEQRQHANTKDMIFDVETLVSYVSENVTLFPGDVILTGSPAGISRMNHGDSVECEIEGIGVLRNQVA